MAATRTPVSVLKATSESLPSLPVFKVPQLPAEHGSSKIAWSAITYSTFFHDVEATARYWANKFPQRGWGTRPTIGLWLKGTTYPDIVHIMGVMGAGFIPQLVSARLTDSAAVYELLGHSGAVALISDPSFGAISGSAALPTLTTFDIFADQGEQWPRVNLTMHIQPDDVLIMAHTSGSMSELPKLVPLTAKWIQCCMAKDSRLPCAIATEQVSISSGSFCHAGPLLVLFDAIQQGACLVLPSTLPYSSAELHDIVRQCSLTRLSIFSSFLSMLLDEARRNVSLLQILRDFDVVFHFGQPLRYTVSKWAREKGIRLFNAYGSTEVGLMMHATGTLHNDEAIVQPPPGMKYEFLPVSSNTTSDEPLVELVVLPASDDCPHHSLRDPTDGKFHTGDLFTEVSPGRYLGRGRNDDWIKMRCALRCDAASIETNVLEACGQDLISAAVVIGSERPSPVLVVERKDTNARTAPVCRGKLEAEIIRRIKPFHERRLSHERIDRAHFILVVESGTLPRTEAKGNIRRKVAEQKFITQLDAIFLCNSA